MQDRNGLSGKLMITGGAGFIGSHLAHYLSDQGGEVMIVDNLSSGRLDNIATLLGRRGFAFVNKDVREVTVSDFHDLETIIHLAANSNVRESGETPSSYFQGNLESTFSVLENTRRTGAVRMFVLASTSSVYGETKSEPVGEHFGPLEPLSVYGATKLGCEALVSAYAHTYGFNALILRFGNVVGPKMRTGVIYDFVAKLLRNNDHLEIWGSGNQAKTYLHIADLIEALILCVKTGTKGVDFYNLSSAQKLTVLEVASIIIREMGLHGVRLKPDGGNHEGVGFVGDLMREIPDNSKLLKLGWHQKHTSAEAVRLVTRALLNEMLPVELS